jgi:hypothetical protein
MTSEELAVINAAMAWRDAVLAHPEALHQLHNANNALTPLLSELSRTTYALAQTREEVCTCSPLKKEYCAATDCQGGSALEPALIWVPRTWADVRLGDRVRMIGSDNPPAYVQTCVHLHWHADPRSSEYRPEALEWAGVRVSLKHGGRYEMDPAKPIEIEIAENEFHILNALGWENRVGVIRDDAS